MRFQLFLHVLPIVAVLVAWAHQQVEPPLRVTLVDSLNAAMAADILPLFQAELVQELGLDRQHVDFEWIDLDVGNLPAGNDLPASLAAADLVVSFGATAAVKSAVALGRLPTRHLLALLPPATAALLLRQTITANGSGAIGWLETSAEDIAFSILGRLLANRSGSPLRVGVLYLEGHDSAAASSRHLGSSSFIPLPVALPAGAATPMIIEETVDMAAAAALGPLPVDAFWLATDSTGPTVDIVRQIIARTGKPVLHASSRAAVAAGALMSLNPEPADLAREAARLARQLLESDGDAVATTGRRIGLALNLTTAAALGIVPPHDLVELSRDRLYR